MKRLYRVTVTHPDGRVEMRHWQSARWARHGAARQRANALPGTHVLFQQSAPITFEPEPLDIPEYMPEPSYDDSSPEVVW